MYVCVCTVAGGSAGNEILVPGQIKSSAAIRWCSRLWSLHRPPENGGETGVMQGKEDIQGWMLTHTHAHTLFLYKMDRMITLGELCGVGKHVYIPESTCVDPQRTFPLRWSAGITFGLR